MCTAHFCGGGGDLVPGRIWSGPSRVPGGTVPGGAAGYGPTPSPREQTDTCKNVTFPQLRLWAVIKTLVVYLDFQKSFSHEEEILNTFLKESFKLLT